MSQRRLLQACRRLLVSRFQPYSTAMSPTFSVSPNRFLLVDDNLHVQLSGLQSHQKVSLYAFIEEEGKKFESNAWFEADSDGLVDLKHHASTGGTYTGICSVICYICTCICMYVGGWSVSEKIVFNWSLAIWMTVVHRTSKKEWHWSEDKLFCFERGLLVQVLSHCNFERKNLWYYIKALQKNDLNCYCFPKTFMQQHLCQSSGIRSHFDHQALVSFIVSFFVIYYLKKVHTGIVKL